MKVTFDPIKRDKTLADRGLDFADAEIVFEGITVEIEDLRKNMVNPASSVLAFWKAEWSLLATRRVARFVTSSV